MKLQLYLLSPPPSNMFPPLPVLQHPPLPPPTTAGSVSTMESRPDLSSPLTELLDHVDHPNQLPVLSGFLRPGIPVSEILWEN